MRKTKGVRGGGGVGLCRCRIRNRDPARCLGTLQSSCGLFQPFPGLLPRQCDSRAGPPIRVYRLYVPGRTGQPGLRTGQDNICIEGKRGTTRNCRIAHAVRGRSEFPSVDGLVYNYYLHLNLISDNASSRCPMHAALAAAPRYRGSRAGHCAAAPTQWTLEIDYR